MKVDYHLHTAEYSMCAVSGEREQLEAALRLGLDAVFITDHHIIADPDRIARLDDEYTPRGLRVFGGVEITLINSYEDVIVLGVHDEKLNNSWYRYRDLHDFVRERGGFLSLCHPFRFSDGCGIEERVLRKYPVDAVETFSINIIRHNRERIVSLAERIGAVCTANSDAHEACDVGVYHNILNRDCSTEAEIIECLRSGDFTVGRHNARIAEYNRQIDICEEAARNAVAANEGALRFELSTGYSRVFYEDAEAGRSRMI